MEQRSSTLEWPTQAKDLVFIKRIGQGYFGDVWQCKLVKSTGDEQADAKPYAVKKVPLKKLKEKNLLSQMEREINILQSLRHQHIVKLFFHFQDDNNVYLGMEFAQGGGMFPMLTQRRVFRKDQAAQFFYEACDALEYLHTRPQKVIHRDIKPENILLDEAGHVLLADFGWSNVLEGAATHRATFCGTPDYLAPEMIIGEGHNEKLDMWTMGVLLYEMLIGRAPFTAGTQENTCRQILRCTLRFPQGMDPDAEDLIRNLCVRCPDERLTATQAKQHAFVLKYYGQSKEVVRILQAKSSTEQQLLSLTDDLENACRELRNEQDLRKASELRLAKLQEQEKRQAWEKEQILAELQRLRHDGQV